MMFFIVIIKSYDTITGTTATTNLLSTEKSASPILNEEYKLQQLDAM